MIAIKQNKIILLVKILTKGISKGIATDFDGKQNSKFEFVSN